MLVGNTQMASVYGEKAVAALYEKAISTGKLLRACLESVTI